MKRGIIKSLILSFVLLGFVSGPVFAAKKATPPPAPAPSPVTTGNDISYPQCGRSVPTNQAFGLVGVNGGLANTTNPCLATQLSWAVKSNGLTNQPKVGLYVNTANPGGLNTASWPQNNVDPNGNAAPNPYGDCDSTDSLPCAWQYGWNRSAEDVRDRFVPAAGLSGISASPNGYTWWLDVETMNTWKSGSSFALASNRADLEGMTAYFNSVGGKVGLYSTALQWQQIAGQTDPDSNLNGLPNWRPSGKSLSNAKINCSAASLTPGGKVTLTQYISNNLDYDYSCI